MEKLLYDMIFKRKSFHIFTGTGKIAPEEISAIDEICKKLKPLDENVRTEIRILPAGSTSCTRGQEYDILIYSEKKEGYLRNVGYIGQQLDLYLASMNIGSLWFGIGKTEEKQHNGLDYVIMFGIAKMPPEKFRKDMFKSKRKPIDEIWSGGFYEDLGNIARFAPSACNTQPWKVETAENEITVYRYKKPGKRGIMPADKVAFYNRIDIGIFMLFLELCFEHGGFSFEKELFADEHDDESETVLNAKYYIQPC
ncbi:MAG: nitroreductase [Oscillospiraceae bacterium]|nr:nitroreductase [Oscillospiraceae bacterium]